MTGRNSAVVCAEGDDHLFEGEVYARILRQAITDGVPDPQSALTSESDDGSRAVVRELQDKRILTPGGSLDAPTAYWDSLLCAPKKGEIVLENLIPSCADILKHALQSNEITVGAVGAIRLIVTDDYLRPELCSVDKSTPWLMAKPFGHTIWIGPLIIPGKTVCFACLTSALQRNRWLQDAAGAETRLGYLPQPSLAALPSTIAVAAGMISTVAAIYLASGSFRSLENTILTFDTRTMTCTYNTVQHVRECPECDPLPAGERAATEALYRFVSPITGVVSSVEVSETAHAGLFHASGSFVQPRCPSRIRPPLRPGLCSGKGFSSVSAQLACIAEGIERYSITYQGTEVTFKGDLDQCELVPPNDIQLFSSVQFQRRTEWNRCHSELHWVPEVPPPLKEITWAKAKSLLTGRLKLIPAGLVYMHFPFTKEPEFCSADTNGCATGTTLPEAMFNAFLELIERDAVAIWWYNRLRRPAIDLNSLGDFEILEIRRQFQREGHDVYVLDVTTDMEIPAYVAVAPAKDGSMPYFGSAAHVSPRMAALKALSEVAQIWFWSKRGGASHELDEWLTKGNKKLHSYLEPIGVHAPLPADVLSIEDGLNHCINRIVRVGVEPMYVDMTRPEVGVPVVRAIAPGLRHFWARFAPGRLYDVPLTMRWIGRKLEETGLNPIPCMI